MNPWRPDSANYYHYAWMKAQDELRDAINPSAEVIHNPKAYWILFEDAKRREKKTEVKH